MARQPQEWRKGRFVVSTDPEKISLESLGKAFDSETCYWAKSFNVDAMRDMVRNSLCFGLYYADEYDSKPNPALVGFARGVTDFTTFAYFTDVYVLPEHQGGGGGKFLIECVNEIIQSMPYLRRAVLITSGDKAIAWYKKILGMKVGVEPLTFMEVKGPWNVV